MAGWIPQRNKNGEFLIKIQEEHTGKETGGSYQACTFDIVMDETNGWKELDVSFPYPIALLSAEWINEAANQGDEINILIGPNTTVGIITADVSNGIKIEVSQAVIDTIKIGHGVKLSDGTNTDDLGRVINVNKNNLKITVENAVTSTFSTATPTSVKQTVQMVPHMRLQGLGKVNLGVTKIGASFVPANTILRLRYNNISATAKTFSIIAEYLY